MGAFLSAKDSGVFKEQKFADKELEAFAVHIKGLEQYYALRRWWPWFVLVWISALIIFNIALTFLVGWRLGGFHFDDMQFIIVITAETFLQIVWLGYVATHYLFSDENSTDKKQRGNRLSKC